MPQQIQQIQQIQQQRNLGTISLINGDQYMTVVATAIIITERGVVKIKDFFYSKHGIKPTKIILFFF